MTLLVLALALACGSTEPVDEFKGAYTLVTVDGKPLPYITTAADVTASLDKELLVISPRGEWSMASSGTIRIGNKPATPTAEIVQGTWHSQGNTITLLSYDPPTLYTAVYSAGTITMDRSVYKKQ